MYRVLMLSISAAVMTWSANAVAASSKLKGDYGYTGTLGCIFSPGTPPTSPPFSTDGQFLALGFGLNHRFLYTEFVPSMATGPEAQLFT